MPSKGIAGKLRTETLYWYFGTPRRRNEKFNPNRIGLKYSLIVLGSGNFYHVSLLAFFF